MEFFDNNKNIISSALSYEVIIQIQTRVEDKKPTQTELCTVYMYVSCILRVYLSFFFFLGFFRFMLYALYFVSFIYYNLVTCHCMHINVKYIEFTCNLMSYINKMPCLAFHLMLLVHFLSFFLLFLLHPAGTADNIEPFG